MLLSSSTTTTSSSWWTVVAFFFFFSLLLQNDNLIVVKGRKGGSNIAFLSTSSKFQQQQQKLQNKNNKGLGLGVALFGRKPSSLLSSSSSSLDPSRVIDEDGPTPPPPSMEPPIIHPDDIPGFHYNESSHPIPHQPWRRGDTDGCEDPIDSPWRLEAESIIKNAAKTVGCTIEGITWYMAMVVITVQRDLRFIHKPIPTNEDEDEDVEDGERWATPFMPEIIVDNTDPDTNIYRDIDDPYPEDDYGKYLGEEDGRIGPDYDHHHDDDGNEYADDNDDNEPPPPPPLHDHPYIQSSNTMKQPTYDSSTGNNNNPTSSSSSSRQAREDVIPDGWLTEEEEMEDIKGPRDITNKYTKTLNDKIIPNYSQAVRNATSFAKSYLRNYDKNKIMKENSGIDADDADEHDDDEDGNEEFAELLRHFILNENGIDKMDPDPSSSPKDDNYDFTAEFQADEDMDNDLRTVGKGWNLDPEVNEEALRIISRAIISALDTDDIEDRLSILSRHELILTSPSFDTNIIETQLDFDKAYGYDVMVYTQDPFESNRVLKGKLMDRNALDVIINMGGNMVTIPNNMIRIVRYPPGKKEKKNKKNKKNDPSMEDLVQNVNELMKEHEEDEDNDDEDEADDEEEEEDDDELMP